MDVIYIALPRPDSKYSSTSFSIAKELSKYHRVFYVENPFTIKDYFSLRNDRDIKSRRDAFLKGKDNIRSMAGLHQFYHVIPPLVIPVNWLPRGFLYNTISWINDRIVYRVIKKVVSDYNLKHFIYFNSFNPFYGNFFPKSFNPQISVYQTVDDIGQAIHVGKHGLRLENSLVSRADLVLTTSTELKRLKSEFSENVHCVPNAADISIFARVFANNFDKPSEYRTIEKKIVIYVGNIKDRIDFKLCREIAESRSEYAFVFIGPINTDEHIRVGLSDMDNVWFIGGKGLEELPAYLQHAHCAIIPFEYNKLTRSIYPLKINEYLGAGLPVVATRFSEDIISFSELIYLAEPGAEFCQGIDRAIAEDSYDMRLHRYNKVKDNNWQKRGELVKELIDRAILDKKIN